MAIRRPVRALAPLALATALTTSSGAWAQDWDHRDLKYGTEDPDRQYLNILLAETDGQAPVCLYAHANGGSADNVGQDSVDRIVEAGYALVSWESIISLASPEDVEIGQADAQLAFDWVRDNAATYGFDPDRIVICGRSRGSVASWKLAHSGHPAIVGAYFYNALPDGTWALPPELYPLNDVSDVSPPMYLAFGPAPGDGDSHDPANLYPVVERYEELGQGEIITLTDSMTEARLDPFHFFPEFVEGLPTDAPEEPGAEGTPDDGGASGCHTAASPGVTWALAWGALLVILGARPRRR
ncbi:MAG: hypothetical protein AAF211_12145 [Myxococcota bacterium]